MIQKRNYYKKYIWKLKFKAQIKMYQCLYKEWNKTRQVYQGQFFLSFERTGFFTSPIWDAVFTHEARAKHKFLFNEPASGFVKFYSSSTSDSTIYQILDTLCVLVRFARILYRLIKFYIITIVTISKFIHCYKLLFFHIG